MQYMHIAFFPFFRLKNKTPKKSKKTKKNKKTTFDFEKIMFFSKDPNKRRRRKIHYSRPAGLDARNPSVWATPSHAYFRRNMVADSI